MTTRTLMNEEELKCWILRRLGSPFLKVELTAAHLQDDIDQAMRWFAAKKGVKRMALMPIHTDINEYTIPEEMDTILDVAFPLPPMDVSMVFSPYILIDEKVPYDVFSAPGSMGMYSSFTQTLQYIEMAKRILSAEPDWRQEDRKLYIFPLPKTEGTMLVEYKTGKFTIDQLNERDHDLIKRYALAMAKLDVGRVRSKYDSFPTAQGSATLDGGTLLAEGQAEIERLDEEIALSGYPIGFISG